MSVPRILLFGANGQVGFALMRALAVVGDVMPLKRANCDLTNAASIRGSIAAAKPNIIVNAAAYTAVDRAESEVELAQAINAAAPCVMAKEAKRAGALFVHYSTDYVFDGASPSPYVETDATSPLNVYGRTKRDGELSVMASGADAFIFRTSWVYSFTGKNFARTILALAAQKPSLRIVDDQIGAPTSADLIADVTAQIVARWLGGARGHQGLYHLTAGGATSWHGFASELVTSAQAAKIPLVLSAEALEPIPSSEYPTPAQRPANSRLDTRKIRGEFEIVLPPWQLHVHRLIAELAAA